jgi:hypothetical protein
MTTESRIGARREEKLITEYPLKEGLAIYLDAWKQLFSTAVKTIAISGLGVLVVAIVSMFLSTAALLGVASAIVGLFTSLIVDHPIFTLLVLVGFIIGLIVLRGRARAV